ncbi:unnamed protein product [Effrenium voratum]|uniref:Uncharacterized protein n=1 Tax=Effrenium voratum TaxID=2562239 RepID=A0AA36HWM8_9DINO|nr:unnamed protein product [Effrenium voratum]CAJ1436230.1 unnamed protein product [Effrenium voratum]
MQGRISKHLSLACEAGAVYRLLQQGVPKAELQIQKELLSAAFGPDPSASDAKFHPDARRRILAATQRHALGAVNASTALHLLAQTSAKGPRIAGGNTAEVSDLVLAVVAGAASPRDLAVASWAVARLGLASDSALAALENAAKAAAEEMDGQDLANVCWAFATMRPFRNGSDLEDPLLAQLAEVASHKAHTMSPRHLAIVTWSLAKARVRHEDFCWSAAGAVKSSKAAKWLPQDLANFLWAFAVLRLDRQIAPLDVVAARAAELNWDKFRPQELSIAMWAAYSLGIRDFRGSSALAVKRMLQHAAREIRNHGAKDFEPQHLMNAAWALARWQRHCRLNGLPQECKDYVCRPALRVLATEAAHHAHHFRAREMSRLVWALASQSCYSAWETRG